jgi:aspartyl-tRNA(Asn)/glutamyl-tRNA(Gln) amidotransferase subunit B
MFNTGKRAGAIVAEKTLSQIGDTAEIREVVMEVVTKNNKAVSDYKSGKQEALTFITGQVMKATRGRANPSLVREILIKVLQDDLQNW